MHHDTQTYALLNFETSYSHPKWAVWKKYMSKYTMKKLKHENRTDVWQYMLQSDRSVSENGGVSKEKIVCGCLYIPCQVLLFVNA